MSTTTKTDDLTALERAAAAAAEQAAEARAKLQAAVDARREAEDRAQRAYEAHRDTIEEQRLAEFERTYRGELAAAKDALRTAVLDGRPEQGWIEYQTKVAILHAERARAARWLHKRAMDRYKALSAQVAAWNVELGHIRKLNDPGEPLVHPRMTWWDALALVQGKGDPTPPRPVKGATRLAQINDEINAVAEALGLDWRREPDAMGDEELHRFMKHPKDPEMSLARGFGETDYTATVARIVQKAANTAATKAAKEHNAAVLAEIKATAPTV
jgi:hypothetical protein